MPGEGVSPPRQEGIMAKETKSQQKTVERVMHEFKHHELTSRGGEPVKKRRQAVAIALSEAGASNRATAKQNHRNLDRSKTKERAGRTGQAEAERRSRDGGPTRAELYAQAAKRGIAGRSRMTKAELHRAVAPH
jgi:hypothetical protein